MTRAPDRTLSRTEGDRLRVEKDRPGLFFVRIRDVELRLRPVREWQWARLSGRRTLLGG